LAFGAPYQCRTFPISTSDMSDVSKLSKELMNTGDTRSTLSDK